MAEVVKAKITYLPQKKTIAVKSSRAEWHSDGLLPLDQLLQRAKNKMNEEKAAGHIFDYFILEKLLIESWERLGKQDPAADPNADVYIPFAFGVTEFPGFTLEEAPSVDVYCLVSISAPLEVVKTWNVYALASLVYYRVVNNRWSPGSPNFFRLKEIVQSALDGKKVFKVPLSGNLKASNIEKSQAPAASAPNKPSVATASSKTQESSKAVSPGVTPSSSQASALPLPKNYPGMGWLEFSVTPDKMKAQISGFKMGYYQDKNVTLDEAWLKNELARQGYVGQNSELLERVLEQMKRQKDLKGLVVASGVEGVGGADPALRAVPPKARESLPANKTPSVRQTKVIPFYKTGEVVAEVYYRAEEKLGTDVFGQPSPAPAGEPYQPELGEGVRRVNEKTFEALRDGLVVIEKDKLDIVQTYLHEGDVSLTSGNLDFDGCIIITGDIDTGSMVKARGDLQVQGSIRGANVLCHGKLSVTGGINTGMKASIHATEGIVADYIENSVVYCKGDIQVQKALLSSRVFSGGSIFLKDSDSRIAGGEIFFWGKINTANIGFSTGVTTHVHMGADWREAIRMHILTTRRTSLENYLNKRKSELRDLVRKKQAQLTAKHKEQLATLKDQILLANKLIEKLQIRLKALRETLRFNDAATVTVRSELAGDVQFVAKDLKIVGDPTVSAFVVRTRSVNNTHFSQITETDAVSSSSEKKAS